MGVYALLAVAVCGQIVCTPTVFAQNQPATEPAPNIPDPGQAPLTPTEERDRQVRQFDPLDREDKDGKEKNKANRDIEKRREQDQTPAPGSIAATEQQSSGPRVVEDDTAGAPIQEYSGPAVLSRSYSVSSPLIPEQVKWQESFGLNIVYDSGVTREVNPDGTPGSPSTLIGTQVSWSLMGRHYFGRDQVSIDYSGNVSEYSGIGAYNGSNQNATVRYSHVISRRLTLNLSGTGTLLSQNYTLENQPVGPETIANINLASSPNIQIFDTGAKQFSSQADLTWQKTSRLSFSAGMSYFGISRNSPLLLGVTGQQARGDVNYRLTRKTTIGSYYSFSHYLYPSGFGKSDTNTAGFIYSYAFNRTMQIRFRGGLSEVESLGLQTVQISPAIAALLGQSSGIIDFYQATKAGDFSAQFVKDFRGGGTASLAYARGISPGNGVFQTSQQESISATVSMKVLRIYSLTANLGRDTLSAIGQTLGQYQSEYGRISVTRSYRRGIGLSFVAEYRYFDISEGSPVRSQLRLTSGVTWTPAAGRLWPF